MLCVSQDKLISTTVISYLLTECNVLTVLHKFDVVTFINTEHFI